MYFLIGGVHMCICYKKNARCDTPRHIMLFICEQSVHPVPTQHRKHVGEQCIKCAHSSEMRHDTHVLCASNRAIPRLQQLYNMFTHEHSKWTSGQMGWVCMHPTLSVPTGLNSVPVNIILKA